VVFEGNDDAVFLVQLAEHSGVSMRMIGLIETGENNVSLAKLGDLASALNLTFSELVEDRSAREEPVANLPKKGIPLWHGLRPGTKVELLQSFPSSKLMELWKWTIAPGDRYQGEPDPPGYQEIAYVVRGELTLEREGGSVVLKSGDSLAFPSYRPYAFMNSGKERLTLILIVVA
jgi:transcriptional regulator with XRE-family HTH domain